MGFFRPRNQKGKYQNRGWLANSQNEVLEVNKAILWNLEQLVVIESLMLKQYEQSEVWEWLGTPHKDAGDQTPMFLMNTGQHKLVLELAKARWPNG